jgi:hypothetical protein
MSMDNRNKALTLFEPASTPLHSPTAASSWTATVLTVDEVDRAVACDVNEVWTWCLARVAVLGKLDPSHARLVTLLSWTPAFLNQARDEAWDCLKQMHCSLEDRQATWEYLSGECLACLALELPWELTVARRDPVKLQFV